MPPDDDNTERAKQYFFRGLDHLDRRDYPEAESDFRAALAIVPGRVSALVNLAVALFRQEKLREAVEVAQSALLHDPTDVEALVALGSAQVKLGDLDAAAATMERAVAAAPADPTALMGRASVRLKLRQFDLAIADCLAVQRIEPGRENLLGSLVTARVWACDWPGLDADVRRLVDGIRAGTETIEPFALLAIDATPADQLRCASATIHRDFPPGPALWRGTAYAHERVRVAYVSGDFRSHPLSRLMAGIFEHHDRKRFEIVAVSTIAEDGSGERRRIAAAPERFVDLSTSSNGDIAAWVRAAEVDIAVDLGGLTDSGRLPVFAMRPAPIQVSYLGFPGTSGAPYIDYLLADRVVIPPEQRQFYSEKIAALPDTYYPTDDQWPTAATVPSRAEAGLPERGFVFCCFNNSYKITPEIFDVWMRLLNAVPGSVLWLVTTNAAAKANLAAAATNRGVASERLVFAARAKFEQHLARHRLADLALDTMPYNAHTTACDALWAGLPLVTCPGETFPSRVAGSVLTAMDLPELVTNSLADYEALALALAGDPLRLAELKAKVAANRTTAPLFQTARFTRNLETAYLTMMERHRQGEPPVDFAVEQPAG